MSKRPRESEPNPSKELLLGLARKGDFVNLLTAIECVTIDSAVLHEILCECTAAMLRMSHDFNTHHAQFVAELKK
jgi:hypothetical protein